KKGVLDVEDIEDFITQLKAEAFSDKGLEIGFIKLIEGMVGTQSKPKTKSKGYGKCKNAIKELKRYAP
ncbi:unnamed protein product, partial [marine sediment metagenome]